jgi:hypothetical protein
VPAGQAAINITAPEPNIVLPLGSDVAVSGLVSRDTVRAVSVALVTFTGVTLLETPADVADNGAWQAALRVPQGTTGPAQLAALVRNADGEIVAEDAIPVLLVVDTTAARYLQLYRPVAGEPAVGGYYFFFDGVAQQPVGGRITMHIRTDNCQEAVASQSFPLNFGGYWQGYIYVPRDVVGPACAVAFFGTPGEDTYREAQVPIELLPRDGDSSYVVKVHNPPFGAELTAGQSLNVYGLAYNARDDVVQIDLQREDGLLLAQATAAVDQFGYWEAVLILPLDAEGPARFSAIIGDVADGDFAEQQAAVTILPAPPPTPGP